MTLNTVNQTAKSRESWGAILGDLKSKAEQSRKNALRGEDAYRPSLPQDGAKRLEYKWRLLKTRTQLRNQIKAWDQQPASDMKSRETKRLNRELAETLSGLEAVRGAEERESAAKWQTIIEGLKNKNHPGGKKHVD